MTKRMTESAFTACLTAVLLAAAGCDVTPSDVKAARENVQQQQLETAEARAEGLQVIREKERREKELREQAMMEGNETARKELRGAEMETAEAKQQLNENVAKEEQETRRAKEEADRLAAELKATEARNAYVREMNIELEKVDARIEEKREQLAKLEGAEHDRASADLDVLKVRREAFSDALRNLNSEEVMKWEAKKPAVEQARELCQANG